MTQPIGDDAGLLALYLSTLDPPDIHTARRLASVALDSGTTPAHIIDTVLRPAQEEVGRRWQNNEWTVAQEHAATAITDAVLALISLRTARNEWPRETVVGGCVEGEWHSMPLRMLCASLGCEGYDVIFLGPSLPAEQFARSLHEINPAAALLSCTTPINLPGARRTIEIAHEAGVPVILGGRALDSGGVRAAALGANAFAANAAAAASILSSWNVGRPGRARPADLCPEGAELEMPQPGLVADCLDELLQRQPRLRDMTTAQFDRTREDIAYILRFCSAALVASDQTVFDDFTLWLRDLLAVRGVPAGTIGLSYECIAAVLGGGFRKTTAMLDSAARLI